MRNIAEILKDCPKGTKLWSPVLGECELYMVARDNDIIILCGSDKIPVTLNKYGQSYSFGDYVLFPSKEVYLTSYKTAWDNFKAPAQHKHFKPFQKVLCKCWDYQTNKTVWRAAFYDYYDEEKRQHNTISGWPIEDHEIIQYEGNENLLGKEVEE